MRVDSARNRAAIVQAARHVVADKGLAAAMDDIAEEAGVAVGTLYRHFPTKADLIAAAVEDSVARMANELEAALASIVAGSDPSAVLASSFRSVAAKHSTDRALKIAAGAQEPTLDTEYLVSSPAARRAADTLEQILQAADEDGALAAPTTVIDMMVLLDGVPAAELGDVARQHYTETVLRGLLGARLPEQTGPPFLGRQE